MAMMVYGGWFIFWTPEVCVEMRYRRVVRGTVMVAAVDC